ncbi:aminoglycoside phosphotransferase family protein [Rhodotorula paludigena]|uniref:aminoglycoside phosphotransferase family protein n=1 Tax=Rhodotorula paludigena TaxID=86838 RepID=UPI00316D2222
MSRHRASRYCGPAPPLSALPKPEDVVRSTIGQVLHEGCGRVIKLVELAGGQKVVVKYGVEVYKGEGEVMRLLRRQTNIPIPEVYHIVAYNDGVFLYLEYIPGENLADVLLRLKAHDPRRHALCAKLVPILDELHSMVAPPGTPIGNYASFPEWSHTRLNALTLVPPRTLPPFSALTTSLDLINWIKSEFLARPNGTDSSWACCIEPGLDVNATVVLSHGDLHPWNVLVRDGEIVALLDWERAGWYPLWVDADVCAGNHMSMKDKKLKRVSLDLGGSVLGWPKMGEGHFRWVHVLRKFAQ